MLEGLDKAEHSLSVMHSVFRELPEHAAASADLEAAEEAVAGIRDLIDEALKGSPPLS